MRVVCISLTVLVATVAALSIIATPAAGQAVSDNSASGPPPPPPPSQPGTTPMPPPVDASSEADQLSGSSDASDGPCTMTLASSRVAPHVAISGTTLTVPLQVSSACGSTVTVKLVDEANPQPSATSPHQSPSGVSYDWKYRSQRWDSRNSIPRAVSNIVSTNPTVSFTPYCARNDTMFTLKATSSNSLTVTIGKLYCVYAYPAAPIAAVLPSKLNVWVSTTSYMVLANSLLAVWSNWDSTKSAYLAGGQSRLMGDASFATHSNFASLQSAANLMVDGTNDFGAANCDGFGTSTFSFPESTGLFIVGGSYRRTAACTSLIGFNAIKAMLLVTDVIVADNTMDAATLSNADTQTVTLGYPDASAAAVRVALERYALYRFDRLPATCGTSSADLVTIPSKGTSVKANLLEERKFYWNGMCGITSCCIGNQCSTEIAADGRSCVLPRIGSFGTKVGVTLKRAGAESFYVHLVLEYGLSNDDIVANPNWNTITDQPAVDDANGAEVSFHRRSGDRNFCMQLSCVPNASSLTQGGISSYSTTLCPAENAWAQSFFRASSPPLYKFTHYEWTRYGWAAESSSDRDTYVAKFTRPSTQDACQCKAVAIRTYPNWAITFPRLRRPLGTGASTSAVDSSRFEVKSLATSEISPISPAASAADRQAYCTCWARTDVAEPRVAQRLAQANRCFKCPATLTATSVLPANFWRIQPWGQEWYNQAFGESGVPSQRCYTVDGAAMGNATAPWGRRCCYQPVANSTTSLLTYIPRYPSTVVASTGRGLYPDRDTERIFSHTTDANAEKVCCRQGPNALASEDATCRLYRDRRNVADATTTPFVTPRGCPASWTPRPPFGWGRGDPYCTTMDGAGFECNFWGEALWTSCQGWKVHTAAEPMTTGAKATILVAVAVTEGNETIVIQRNNQTGNSAVRVNGVSFESAGYSGLYLSFVFDQSSSNKTIVRVTSVSGKHAVEVESLTSSLTLSVAPDASCIGTCSGLMGNCDGDASNDIKSLDGTVTMAATAAGDSIFSNVVTSFLINNTNNTLFDNTVSVPDPSTPFVPNFVTAATLASCPTSCNNDAGCCLDNEVAGPTFAAETATTVTAIETTKNSSVPLTGYNWPPNIFLTPNVGVLTGLTITQEISASDTDGIASLVISACDDTDVTCTRESTTTTSDRKYTLTMTATRNFTITVTAVDSKGAKTVSYMAISALPPPVKPATSQSFTFTVPGTGFTAAEVYTVRQSLAKDLAAMVNAYWAANNSTSAPAFTAAGDFTVSSVAATTGGVSVTVFIAGSSLTESAARLAALTGSLTLTETLAALVQLTATDAPQATAVPGTTTLGGSTPTTTTANNAGSGSSGSNTPGDNLFTTAGASTAKTGTLAVAAVMSVLLVAFIQ